MIEARIRRADMAAYSGHPMLASLEMKARFAAQGIEFEPPVSWFDVTERPVPRAPFVLYRDAATEDLVLLQGDDPRE